MNTPDMNPRLGDDDLHSAERKLLHAAATGSLVDLRAGDDELDDPAQASAWGADRTVRAEFLAELLTGERTRESGRLRAVKLRSARIAGPLDLEARTLICPLLLHDCYIEEPVDLSEATAVTIRLPGCYLPALTATQLRTAGNLELTDGFTASGEVNLHGAHIGGQLGMTGASLANESGEALTADGLTVELGMFCGKGFSARGEIRLPGAHIGGPLDMSGASLVNEDGEALTADGVTVELGMFCGERFTARGRISLVGAHIGGQLDMSGASLANEQGEAMNADRLTVEHDVICRERFTARGQISLVGAHIGGNLDMSGATLINEHGEALTASGIAVEHDVICSEGFTTCGQISLPGARIGGNLDMSGARLLNEQGEALIADRLTVEHDVFCRERFSARGRVSLPGVRIGGQLDMSGASLANEHGEALNAEGLTVEQDMFCREGFYARGEIDLRGARVGGQLDMSRATLANDGGTVLVLDSATVGTLALRPLGPLSGSMDLTNAKAGPFIDDPASWPATVYLRGFVYDTLEYNRVSVRERLRWLTLDPDGYTPQIYDQLMSTYRRAGQEDAARKVAVAKQWRSRSATDPLNWVLYATVGYGYRNWLAGVWLAVLLSLGTWVYSGAHMIAIKAHPPAFHPVAYTLDVLLPVVDFGQQSAWQPEGWALYWSWVLIGTGWVLTTAVIAGLAGVLQRD